MFALRAPDRFTAALRAVRRSWALCAMRLLKRAGIGLFTLLLAYVGVFCFMRFFYLPSVEGEPLSRHWSRPAYETIFYPLRALAAGTLSTKKKILTGILSEVSENQLIFDWGDGGSYSIGFKCAAGVCPKESDFRAGDAVIAIFGSAAATGHEGSVNKLLLIRKCEAKDSECEAAKADQEEREKARRAAYTAEDERFVACTRKMRDSLSMDPRYVDESTRPNGDKSRDVMTQYTSMAREPKTRACLERIVDSHQKAVYDSCERHGCGKDIGGGCVHIAGYSISNAVLAAAVASCGT